MTGIVLRSLAVACGGSALAVMLAAALALAAIGHRNRTVVWSVRLVTSFLLLPGYVVAGAWSAGFGSMGWWTLSQVTAAKAPLVGIASVIWIHAMAAVPIAFWILWTGLVRASRSPLELAATEGATIHRIRFGIWPHWRYWIGVAFFWIAAWIGGEMAITNLFQVTTLTEKCYLSMIAGEWDASSALLTVGFSATFALIGAALMFSIGQADRPARESSGPISTSILSSWFASLTAASIAAIVGFTPLMNLTIKAGWQPRELSPGEIERFWSPTTAIANVARVPIEYAEEFYWSILLATVAAMVAWSIAWGGAWMAADSSVRPSNVSLRRKPQWWLAFLLIAFSLPGPIVGAMVLRFFQLPFSGLAWLNDHTLLAPVLCLQFRLLSLGLISTAVLVRRWKNEVRDAWQLDRDHPWGRRIGVFLKAHRGSMGATFVLLFSIAIAELSVYLNCLPPGVTTVSMRIFDLLHYGVRSNEAGLLLFLVLSGMVVGGSIFQWTIHRQPPGAS